MKPTSLKRKRDLDIFCNALGLYPGCLDGLPIKLIYTKDDISVIIGDNSRNLVSRFKIINGKVEFATETSPEDIYNLIEELVDRPIDLQFKPLKIEGKKEINLTPFLEVNKDIIEKAFTGGGITLQEQYKEGGCPSICDVLFLYGKVDPSSVKTIETECRKGHRACGECKNSLVSIIEKDERFNSTEEPITKNKITKILSRVYSNHFPYYSKLGFKIEDYLDKFSNILYERIKLCKDTEKLKNSIERTCGLVIDIYEELESVFSGLNFLNKKDRDQFFVQIFDSIYNENALNFVSVCCPDYSYDKTGKYDFKTLNQGVGILAEAHMESLSKIFQILQEHKISFNYYLITANNEAEDKAFLDLVGCNSIEFERRCESTIKSTQKELNERFPDVNTYSMGLNEFLSSSFKHYRNAYYNKIPNVKKLQQAIEKVAKARLRLYKKIFGEEIKIEDAKARAVGDIADYMAVHACLSKLKNPIFVNHQTSVLSLFNCAYLVDETQTFNIPVLMIKTAVY